MRKLSRRLKGPCLAAAFVTVWICGTGSAWAGDGGESLTGLNNIISGLCSFLNITTPCPQLPTITQAVLEIAGLETSPPEMIRAFNSVAPGSTVDAGNAAALLSTPFPLNSKTSPTLSGLLATLTPLAFISTGNENYAAATINSAKMNQGTAAATQLYDPDADTFLYAVASGASVGDSGLTVPDAVNFFYDDSSRTNSNLPQGEIVAKFSLPLTVLNSDGMTERPVAATLQYIPASDGGCSASKIVGNFSGAASGTQTLKAAKLGVNCAVEFAASPISPKSHAIFEVQVPLLVTMATDPPYFYSYLQGTSSGPVNLGIPTAFTSDVDGFAPASGILGPNGMYIGIAPSAAPLCATTGTCPPSTPPVFALCANLPQNGNGQSLVPSVGAYYAISLAGETLLSAALPASSTSICPAL